MKKLGLLTWGVICTFLFFSSCSKDEECDNCHITITGADGSDSLAWHITDASGADILFCGEDLHSAEESYTVPSGQYLLEENGGDTLFAGTYTHQVDGYEIHCHED